jgi:site-specific DNA-methyltransferase (adenine-specific)
MVQTRAKKSDTNNIIAGLVQGSREILKYENPDWGTVAFLIPKRALAGKLYPMPDELKYNCIYFLIGTEESYGIEKVYVGQAGKGDTYDSPALHRLRQHIGNQSEKYHDIWDYAIVCTGKDDSWTLDDLNALKHAFYTLIAKEKNLNGNNPNHGGADLSIYKDKIHQIKNYVTAMEFSIFENDSDTKTVPSSDSKVKKIDSDLRVPEYITPHNVVSDMCDRLPESVWNDQTVFLDPACKGGEYLEEIFNRLMDSEDVKAKHTDTFERAIHILRHQLYGIALSRKSFELTTGSLKGMNDNIRIIPYYIDILKGVSKHKYNIQKIINNIFGFGEDMKFNVVIGNPPYQDHTSAIYPAFIDMAMDLDPDNILMIVKNNWMTSDTIKSTRERMIKYGLTEIINYPIIKDVFSNVSVAVNIFQIVKGYTGETHIINIENGKTTADFRCDLRKVPFVIMSHMDNSIVQKVDTNMQESFAGNVCSAEYFRITSDLRHGRNESKVDIDHSVLPTDYYNVAVVGLNETNYININDVPSHADQVNKYKIAVTSQLNNNNTVIASVIGLRPGEVCTGTYVPVYMTDDMNEANNVYSYIKTKFFRFLVKQLCDGRTIVSAYRFNLVPMQDFSKPWTDEELYKKYNLTSEEINYIENTITGETKTVKV